MEGERVLTERQQFWLDHIRQCEHSGQTTKDYAAAHGLSVSMMYSWRKKLVLLGIWTKHGARYGVPFDRVRITSMASSGVAADIWRVMLPNGIQVDMPSPTTDSFENLLSVLIHL